MYAWRLDLDSPDSTQKSQTWWLICIPSAGEVETGGSLGHTSQLALPIKWAPGSTRDLVSKKQGGRFLKWHPRLALCTLCDMHWTCVHMRMPLLHRRTDYELWGDSQHESFLLCPSLDSSSALSRHLSSALALHQWLGGNVHSITCLVRESG